MEYALSLKSPIGKYRIFNLLIFEEINWLSHNGKIRVDIAHEVDMSLSDHFCHLSAVYYISTPLKSKACNSFMLTS